MRRKQQRSFVGAPSPARSGDKEAGFSLLEALVALAVLAIALLPILALQGQFVGAVKSLERAEQRLSFQASMRAELRAINLSVKQSGEIVMPYGQARWQATPSVEMRPVRDSAGLRSRFQSTLYRIDIQVQYSSGITETIQMQGLGWIPIRSFLENL